MINQILACSYRISQPFLAAIGWLQNVFAGNLSVGATLALIVFSISTSGIIYNLQNDTTLFGYDATTKRKLYIHPNSRSQFMGEGFLFSFMNTALCLLILLVIGVPRIFAKQKRLKFLRQPAVSRVVSSLLLFATWYIYRELQKAVLIKVPYFQPTFLPDETFVRGGIRRDRLYGE